MGESAVVPARRGWLAGRCASCSSVSRGRWASVGCAGRAGACAAADAGPFSDAGVVCWFSLIVSSVTGLCGCFCDTMSWRLLPNGSFLSGEENLSLCLFIVLSSPTVQILLTPTMVELRFCKLYRGLAGVVMISL